MAYEEEGGHFLDAALPALGVGAVELDRGKENRPGIFMEVLRGN